MLSREDNERLVRVGPGTVMGNLMRLYWIPFLLSADLVADGRPKRVRLLNEDLVAFRDSEGKVGLIDNACLHRGAPLMFGRNEECGLRCVYHGWKYDIEGRVVETPAEPARSRFKESVRIKAYPCRERNGVIWTYMGPNKESLPPLPNMEWNLVSAEQVHVSIRVQECNWLQALEGDVDSAHAPILHGRIDSKGNMSSLLAMQDLRPTFDCVRQDFGLSIAARRHLPNGKVYWRVNQFVMPFYTLTPPQAKFPELSGHAWVPMDDEHTLCVMFSYHPNAPLYPKSRKLFEEGYDGRETGHPSRSGMRDADPSVPYSDYWTKFNPENDFQLNYESQVTKWFSGLPGLWVQDAACQCLTPIYDRTKEKLGVSDAGIVMTRRVLLEAIAAYQQHGTIPNTAVDPDAFMVRSVALQLADDESWVESGREPMTARLGAGFGYEP